MKLLKYDQDLEGIPLQIKKVKRESEKAKMIDTDFHVLVPI
jgi:hypothetical protein